MDFEKEATVFLHELNKAENKHEYTIGYFKSLIQEEQNRTISLLQFTIEYYACRGWLYKQDEIVTPVLESLISDIQKGKRWDTAPIFQNLKQPIGAENE